MTRRIAAAAALAALVLLLRAPPSRSDATVPPRDGGVAAPAPTGRCAATTDCAWEDPCSRSPHRCRARSELHRPEPSCAHPVVSDDHCVCAGRVCTRLAPQADPAPACASDGECAFDPVSGQCARSATPPAASGPACRCQSGRCVAGFPQPVSCRTWRDCSEFRRAPAPAKLWPRGRGKVRPCKDGESDVICNHDHVCQFVAWPC